MNNSYYNYVTLTVFLLVSCFMIGSVEIYSLKGFGWIAIITGLWLYGYIKKVTFLKNIFYLNIIVLSLYGIIKTEQSEMFSLSIIGILVAWDLERFHSRLQLGEVIYKNYLIKRHIMKLSLAVLSGVALFRLIRYFRIELSIWFAWILIALFIISLNLVIKYSMKK